MRLMTSALLIGIFLGGCDKPELPSHNGNAEIIPQGFAAPLTDAELERMPPEQQYEVVDKLLSTMFKGMPPEQFLSFGSGSHQTLNGANLSYLRKTIQSDLSQVQRTAADQRIYGLDEKGNPDPDIAKYNFDNDGPRQLPLARIYEYPLSRDSYLEWIAYFLANTILFSPALEMESTGIGDVQNTVRSLVNNMREGLTVREIVRAHLPTAARWRVSRSPENHALEAYELYLGLFETEQDSEKGGIACKEWYLTDEDEGYQLVRSDVFNLEPQEILTDLNGDGQREPGEGYYITSCNDLFNVVANHKLLIPRVIEVVVNYLMSGRTTVERQAMIQDLVNSNVQTFEDIFTSILFSKQYLLYTERPRSIEENLMSLLAKFYWDSQQPNQNSADEDLFRNMSSRRRSFSQMNLREMGWDSLSYKIGRPPDVSMDPLSFANYHKALREQIFGDRDIYRRTLLYSDFDTDQPTARFVNMKGREYLDYLFLLAVQRLPTSAEQQNLLSLFQRNDNDSNTPAPGLSELNYIEGEPLTGLAYTQADGPINFNFQSGAPAGLPSNYFSIRWEGSVTPAFSETLTFTVRGDDGYRLWVNNQLLIDRWQVQSTTTQSANIDLQANQNYPIKLEYFEASGGANIRLNWSSAQVNNNPIPLAALGHDGQLGNGLLGSYFRNNGVYSIDADHLDDMALVTFDYLSRLPEFYYFNAIEEAN